MSICLSVRAVSRHCPDRQINSYYPTDRGGQHGWQGPTGGASTGVGGTGGEGPGGGKLDRCIMHQVHSS